MSAAGLCSCTPPSAAITGRALYEGNLDLGAAQRLADEIASKP